MCSNRLILAWFVSASISKRINTKAFSHQSRRLKMPSYSFPPDNLFFVHLTNFFSRSNYFKIPYITTKVKPIGLGFSLVWFTWTKVITLILIIQRDSQTHKTVRKYQPGSLLFSSAFNTWKWKTALLGWSQPPIRNSPKHQLFDSRRLQAQLTFPCWGKRRKCSRNSNRLSDFTDQGPLLANFQFCLKSQNSLQTSVLKRWTIFTH